MKLNINVTQNDINKGVKKSCTSCPIARAIKRLKVVDTVYVYPFTAYINEQHRGLPVEAWQFIQDFDGGREVKPFKFTLEIK